MMDVGRHPNIELMTYSEVESVSGYVGNFTVRIRQRARSVDMTKCTGCGSCVLGCPFGVLSRDMVRHFVGKCDLCMDLVARNELPRCVATCCGGALRYEEITELETVGLFTLSGRSVGHSPLKRR